MEVRFPDWKILFGESRTPLSARVTDFGLDVVAGNGNRKQGGALGGYYYTHKYTHIIYFVYIILCCAFMTYSSHYVYMFYFLFFKRPSDIITVVVCVGGVQSGGTGDRFNVLCSIA